MKQFHLILIRMLFLLVFLGSYTASLAQERVVSGKVTSMLTEIPLPGVNISMKGKCHGTVTDVDGNYSISVTSEDVLVFSFIGYNKEEVPVSSMGRDSYDLSLSEDILTLFEVVVTSFGIEQEKKY